MRNSSRIRQARFYLLPADMPDAMLSAREVLTCQLAAEQWRDGLRILLFCTDQQQAERLDEALWQRDPEQFVPHNLTGEGPHYGAPVELAWPEKRSSASRDLLINLTETFADFATAFHQVIDFVPHEETLKDLARERYKAYRRAGFTLSTHSPTFATAPTLSTDNDSNNSNERDGQNL